MSDSSVATASTPTPDTSSSNNNTNRSQPKKPKSLQIISSPPIIKKLPDDVQQFLKSGTNIGSLSDCIKELVENAIDAHATNIEILLTQSGFTSICVKDNGDGIPQENFDTLCKRYYTHKYSEIHKDGQQCDYLGYKGEALNSICNISKDVHVKTKYGDNESELGSHIIYDKRGEKLSVNSIRHSKGTTIVVNELFSALPVRRKCFQNDLKKQVEHTVTILKRIALIHFNIRFLLKDGEKTLFLKLGNIQTMKASLQAVFGAGNIYEHLYFYDGSLNNHSAATHDTCTSGIASTDANTSSTSTVTSSEHLPHYSIQCYVPLYETIAKSNDTSLTPDELSPLKDITKFFSTTKPHIYANNRVILEYQEIQQAMKDIFSNFFRNQKGVSSNLFYILVIQVDSHYFDVTINPNKTKMISSIDEAIKKELQMNIIKHYAEEVRKFKELNNPTPSKLLSQDDPNIIDNSNAVLNVSRILASSPSIKKNQSSLLSTPPSSTTSSNNTSPSFSLSSQMIPPSTPMSSRRSELVSPSPTRSGGSCSSSSNSNNTTTSSHNNTPPSSSRVQTSITSFTSSIANQSSTNRPNRDISLDDSLLDTVQSLDQVFGSPILPNDKSSGAGGINQQQQQQSTRSSLSHTRREESSTNELSSSSSKNISTENHCSVEGNSHNAIMEDDHVPATNHSSRGSVSSTAASTSTTTTSQTNKRVHAGSSLVVTCPPSASASDFDKFKAANPKKRKTLQQTSINLVSNATQQEQSNYDITIQEAVDLSVEYLTKKRKKFMENITSDTESSSECQHVLKSDLSNSSKIQILGSIQHKLGILYHCEHKKLLFANLLQMKEDCLYHSLLQTYDLSTSIMPLSQPLNLLSLLSKDAKTSKIYRRLCIKKEYQSIFQQNGFQVEFEVELLPNEKQKRIIRIDLVGIVSNTVFNTNGTTDHHSYTQDDLIEILNKLDEFERDILKNEDIVKLISEGKITKEGLISECRFFFRPNVVKEFMKNHCHRYALATIRDSTIQEICTDLKNTSLDSHYTLFYC
ncbi:hypothetical protein C9374_007102 [Naegleria lovaniensis]|uniref:Uncharacterized protein n=1 Tax=Naegleria lovaniensis TaxID=51637 RepID=A0AA88H4D1_NAELO|nr:uncharacterized protein C9374_007102 [Naegleria lovaniensis]KAG2393571.1 hypothetical protein C9374_007102 [Naegleria lovaniensis]